MGLAGTRFSGSSRDASGPGWLAAGAGVEVRDLGYFSEKSGRVQELLSFASSAFRLVKSAFGLMKVVTG
jgi:hypothetical protein